MFSNLSAPEDEAGGIQNLGPDWATNTPSQTKKTKLNKNQTKTNPSNKNLSNNKTKPYTFFKALLLFIIILHLIPKQNGLLLFPSGVFSKQLSFLAKVLRSKEDLLKIERLTSNQLKFLSSTRISFNLFAFRTVGFSKQEQVRTTQHLVQADYDQPG